MKKIVTYPLLACAFLLSAACTKNVQANYVGPTHNADIMTVEEVLVAPDDTIAIIDGYIINKINFDEYTFQDKNGDTIIIEIDNEIMWPSIVDEDLLLRIHGEVDTEMNEPNTFEVEYLQIL